MTSARTLKDRVEPGDEPGTSRDSSVFPEKPIRVGGKQTIPVKSVDDEGENWTSWVILPIKNHNRRAGVVFVGFVIWKDVSCSGVATGDEQRRPSNDLTRNT